MNAEHRYGDVLYSHQQDSELTRLTLLGRLTNEHTLRCLGELRPRPEWRCLEIGAGTGHIASVLAHEYGATVLATDLDTSLFAPEQTSNLRIIEHDITTESFPDGHFDLIVARYVFEHLRERDDLVRKTVRWLRPGGSLLVEDFSDCVFDSSPNEIYAQVMGAFFRTLTETIGSDITYWARRFPQPLAAAGLRDIGVDAALYPCYGGGLLAEILRLSVDQLAPSMISTGSVTETQIRELNALLADPDFFDLGLISVAAWGRRVG
ncbi:class I SAM-dependent methyltransferase [Nocardia panacis]|uniref:Class I SAM-dependent methyltransferase n=1 Tax=Nocardia panacis TaxID=2340916 RepID=A0A3A4K2Q9_9NOCA|nr:class I SAM-dependent methyltransferase [Nocardia panacis]RJO70734.1 class I SAM-dependent methyltransferase [Nocardia panacis]